MPCMLVNRTVFNFRHGSFQCLMCQHSVCWVQAVAQSLNCIEQPCTVAARLTMRSFGCFVLSAYRGLHAVRMFQTFAGRCRCTWQRLRACI